MDTTITAIEEKTTVDKMDWNKVRKSVIKYAIKSGLTFDLAEDFAQSVIMEALQTANIAVDTAQLYMYITNRAVMQIRDVVRLERFTASSIFRPLTYLDEEGSVELPCKSSIDTQELAEIISDLERIKEQLPNKSASVLDQIIESKLTINLTNACENLGLCPKSSSFYRDTIAKFIRREN